MKFMIRPRQGGKTTEAVKRAAADFLYIVVADRERARHVFRVAADMGLDIPFPITFREFTQRAWYGKGINGFVIEDVESLLQHFAGIVPVALVTATGEMV